MEPRPDADNADADSTDASRITVSGHQVELGAALRERATADLADLATRYFGGVEDMACTFTRTGDGGFGCSLRVHSGKGLFFDAGGEGRDAYTALRQAIGRAAKQLRREKRALRDDKPVNPDKAGLV